MKKIDFLPPRLREEHDQRRRIVWRCVLLGCCAVVLSAIAFAKHRQRISVETRLEEVRRQYDSAVANSQLLANLQGRLASLNAQAELLVYLRHDWPRTQVLDAVLPALPASIQLSRLQIRREAVAARGGVPLRDPARRPAAGGANEPPQQAPAEADLEALRQEADAAPATVVLEGHTNDIVALNRYLGGLTDSALIERADLESIESLPDDRGQSTFRARVTLRPGYGQPRGPILAAATATGGAP